MAHRFLVGPSVEPVTLEFFRDHAKLDGSESDALLTMYLKAARRSIEHRLLRSIMSQQHAITLDGFPDAIELQYPALSGDLITSIDSLKYYDASGTLITASSAIYSLDPYTTPGYVVPSVGTVWPDTQERINAVEVVYTAGFEDPDDVPEPIVHAILLRAAAAVEVREETISGALSTLPFVDRMLDEFQIWNL